MIFQTQTLNFIKFKNIEFDVVKDGCRGIILLP